MKKNRRRKRQKHTLNTQLHGQSLYFFILLIWCIHTQLYHNILLNFNLRKKKDKLFALKATKDDIPSNQLKIQDKKNMKHCEYTVWKVSKKVEC